jgi:FkbM family methyltransferase
VVFVLLVLGFILAIAAMDHLAKSKASFAGLVGFVNVGSPIRAAIQEVTLSDSGNKLCAWKAAQENVKLLVRQRNTFDNRGEGVLLHNFLRVHSRDSRICVIVDIGANTGIFSLAAVRFASLIEDLDLYAFAYEPVESTYKKLVEAVSASKGKIRPLNLGVGQKNKMLPIRFTGTGDQGATFLSHTYASQNGTMNEMVQVVALDDEVQPSGNVGQLGGLITVVKISTEGFNYRTLQGMRNLLSKQIIQLIMWEYDVRESTVRMLTTEIEFIRSHGYVVFILGSKLGRTLDYYLQGGLDDDSLRLLRVDGIFSNKQLESIRKKYQMKYNLVAVAENNKFLESDQLLNSLPCGLDGCSCLKNQPVKNIKPPKAGAGR